MPVVLNEISTTTVRKADAFAYWQELIVDTFVDLDCESSVSKSFSGHIEDAHFGELQISRMKSSDIHIHRSRPRISRANGEFGLLVFQKNGRTEAEQYGKNFTLNPGDFALFDSARSYDALLYDDFEHIVLKIPRDRLVRSLGPLEILPRTGSTAQPGRRAC